MTVTYRVDQALYHTSDHQHDISLVTTEYQYGNELLVHLLFGPKNSVRLNDRLDDLLEDGAKILNEYFFYKKTYTPGNAKPVTRSTFEARKRRFDISQTAIEREILEEYTYIDKSGLPCRVKIVMTDNGDTTTAVIDFEDREQYENFSSPAWLTDGALY
ncbi:MAG: hypothetical protein LBI19_03680 [Oscillospiraceae bacterium]|jgi:hypothetical protein|nr:hypothetical protein [Oscillospiraceae bacterium]